MSSSLFAVLEGKNSTAVLCNAPPRRAVRKVLGDSSQCYTGSSESASSFLCGAYDQQRPDPSAIQDARSTYDSCIWTQPSDDESNCLASPPSREDITWKLKRASNTAPGADGVEYKNISRLDPDGRLLELLYQAVWRFGVPASWKATRKTRREQTTTTTSSTPSPYCLHCINFYPAPSRLDLQQSRLTTRGYTWSRRVFSQKHLAFKNSLCSLSAP